jgi:phosphate transport system substrate-binding protein
MHTKQDKPDQAKAALDFFSWCYANGDALAQELNYVPIPASVVKIVKSTWAKQIKAADGQGIYSQK